MSSNCYYDWDRMKPFAEEEAEPYEQWLRGNGRKGRFTIHPQGIWIFLSSPWVEEDEYSNGDPYHVEDGLNSTFQRQRKDLTLKLVARALSVVGGKSRILDVACGKGYITQAIHEANPECEVYGFDLSVSAVRWAAEKHPDLVLAVADAESPPYPAEFFDCIVCNNIWEHIENPIRLLSLLARSLKKDGCIIVSTPSRYRLNNLLRVLIGKPVAFASSQHVTEYSVGQMFKLFRYAGFRVELMEGSLNRPGSGVIRDLLKYLLGVLLDLFLKTIGSHHRLGQTVFYLIRRERHVGRNI